MTEPVYFIGQSLGILSTICAIARPFCKRKMQILALNIGVNLLVATNYILIGQFGSGALLGLYFNEKKNPEKRFARAVSVSLRASKSGNIPFCCSRLKTSDASTKPSTNFGNLSHTMRSEGR